jgi:hypothetical protein
MKRLFDFFSKKTHSEKKTRDKIAVRMTETGKVKSLIQRLRPLSCGKDLIRLGPRGDGGYLLPNDLEGIAACFSPGVAAVSGFEKDCADIGMMVFLADKSVDQPAEIHPNFQFTSKYVGATSNADFMTMDSWVAASLPESRSDLLLQIDIEGYEYEVFLSMSERLMRRFRIIVAEFHHLKQLWNGPFFSIAARAFEKILQTHTCVHIHPNNYYGSFKKKRIEIPKLMEFTFLRNDHVVNPTYRHAFPHPLDCDNTENPPLILPTCWYRAE